jgi:TonB family protein
MATPAPPAATLGADWVPLLWLAGTLACLLRLLLGFASIARLRIRSTRIGEYEGVALLRSRGAVMPMAVGILRRAILLPAEADEWPRERRNMVVAHELAHVRRRDCLVQAMAQAAFSLFWFHPLAWWAWRQLILEREHASDDLVLAAGFRASDYASQLLEVARSLRPARAGVAMARRRELEGRLLAILDANQRRGVVTRAGTLAAIACMIGLVLPLAAMRPAPQVEAPEVLTDELLHSSESVRLRAVAKAEMEHGYTENAQKLYQRLLELRRGAFGEQSAEYATALVDLARAYQAGGKGSAEVVSLYGEALPIQEARLGPNDPEVATTLYYLGLDAHHRKDVAGAQQLYQRALDIRSKAYGSSDPRVAEVMTPLALLTDNESLYQRSLSILDAAGQKTPDLALTLELYASFLSAHGRAAEAEPLVARAKEIRTALVEQIGLRRVRPGSALAEPKPSRVGPGITAPRVKSKVEPEYSDIARIAKYQGTVVLYIEVGKDGRAGNIQLTRGVGMGLDEKAAEAVSRWTFTPATRNGEPVTVAATVEVNFRLM